jgi:hypothetical protein
MNGRAGRHVGDAMRRRIARGSATSRFGIAGERLASSSLENLKVFQLQRQAA